MEETLIPYFQNAPYLISLAAGILTFLSPCVLPLIPAYLSFITGLSARDLSQNEQMSFMQRLKIIKASLLFILGFGIVFISLGAMMAGVMSSVFHYKWIPWLSGGIIIVFGLHFIGLIKIKFLYYEKRASIQNLDESKTGFLASVVRGIYPLLLGLAFALGWTPCIGPIFASIISLAASDSSQGLSLMVFYTAGLGIPFLLSGLLTSYFLSAFNKFKHHLRKVEIVSGVLLIIIGVMIITGDLAILSTFLLDVFGAY